MRNDEDEDKGQPAGQPGPEALVPTMQVNTTNRSMEISEK